MSDLEPSAPHADTMKKLDAAKRISSEGVEYWMARDLSPILGYPVFQNFEGVVQRASDALVAAGKDPSQQIMLTHKQMGSGQTAKDYYLSRGASYLIAMNGEPSKAEVAAAQLYFAAKARQMEVEEQMDHDRKRLDAREKVTKAFKRVSGVAQDAGVSNRMQPVFHAARFQGLYGMSRSDIQAAKGLKDGENLLDHAGALELSMHDFQMNLAAEVITRDKVRGERAVIARNETVAKEVRQAVVKSRGRLPERLPLEAEPISTVKKRLQAKAPKQVRGPMNRPTASEPPS